jgi:hypothetical protein
MPMVQLLAKENMRPQRRKKKDHMIALGHRTKTITTSLLHVELLLSSRSLP